MSRAEREIAAAREDRRIAMFQLQDERRLIREAVAKHPACPRCGALQAALDAARETINALAAERPP